MSQAPARPILRYHGGKFELADWIISHFPDHHVYVEPFGGAASVLMRKPRCYAEIYNDMDGEIVNLFNIIRDRSGDLLQIVRDTPFARDEYAAAFKPSTEPLELARQTLIRSHMGFAGAATHGNMSGFRSRSVNSGSHPCNQWRVFPDHLEVIIRRWRGVVIENRPALEVITMQDDPTTLFYLDPPYVAATRDAGGDYRHELTDADHRQLAALARTVKGMVVLSGYHSPLYDELYGDWHRVERDALADGARPRVEVLWFSPNAMKAEGLFSASEGK